MKLRITLLFSASLAVICAMLGLMFASSAGADSGSTSPVVPLNTSCTVTDLITLAPTGNAVVYAPPLTEPCPFASGSTTTESYAGSPFESKTAPADGLITLTPAAHDPELSIDGGPFMPAVFGVNTVVATGLNSAGGTNTATFLIDIVQSTVSNTGSGSSGGGSTGSGSGGGSTGSLTGTNTGKSTGTVGLAFTGANLAALIAAALFMLLVGSAIVIYARRKAMERHLEYAVDHPDQPLPLAISDLPDTTWQMKNIW